MILESVRKSDRNGKQLFDGAVVLMLADYRSGHRECFVVRVVRKKGRKWILDGPYTECPLSAIPAWKLLIVEAGMDLRKVEIDFLRDEHSKRE